MYFVGVTSAYRLKVSLHTSGEIIAVIRLRIVVFGNRYAKILIEYRCLSLDGLWWGNFVSNSVYA